MDKNIKILGLVLVGLFLVFLISGGITGNLSLAGLKFWGAEKSVQPSDGKDVISGDPMTEKHQYCSECGKWCKTSCADCCSVKSVSPTTGTSGCISLKDLCASASYGDIYYNVPSEAKNVITSVCADAVRGCTLGDKHTDKATWCLCMASLGCECEKE